MMDDAPPPPVASFTPNEAWFFAELAQRSLVASLDGGDFAPIVLVANDPENKASAHVELHAQAESIHLVVTLEAKHAIVALRPIRVNGSAWHDTWVLEIIREDTDAHWILEPNGPGAAVEDARAQPLRVELRIKKRALLRHEEVIPIHDVAFHRHTRQSSIASPRVGIAWSPRTNKEASPWWEIDLTKQFFIASLRVEIANAVFPAGTRMTIDAYAFTSKALGVPRECFTYSVDVADLSRSAGSDDGNHDGNHDGYLSIDLPAETIARQVRISLAAPDHAPIELLVTSLEVSAVELFADSLRGTMRRAFALHQDRSIFLSRREEDGSYQHALSYRDVWTRAMTLANELAHRLEPATRDDGRVRLGVLLHNRPEWIMCDLAAIERSYVLLPMSPEDSDDRLRQILDRARPDAIVCEAEDVDRALSLGKDRGLRLVIACDSSASSPSREGVVAFDDLLRPIAIAPAPAPAPHKETDLYSVLFTSGSTGAPKGAMRSYDTFLKMLESYGGVQSARHLAFQPLSHLSERMGMSWFLVSGAAVAFSRGGAHLMEELRAFEPTEIMSVPRLFDVLHAQYKRRLRTLVSSAPDSPLATHEKTALAEARASFGSRLRSVSVGSAPVSAEVLAFMRRCFDDLWVSEGYGSTEVGTIAIDNKIVAGVDVKLVPPDRGEIWVRTTHVISGYLGDDGATNSAIDADGYFATGDLGERAADGTVRVVGRLRNAVKLAQGEFVSAEPIETVLVTAPHVDRIYVHVEGGALGVAALVFPSLDHLKDFAEATLRAHGRRNGLSAWEIPRGIIVETDVVPSVENGLLTNTGKLARAAIAERYGARLSALVNGSASGEPESDHAVAVEDSDDLDLTARLIRIVGRVLGRSVDASLSLRGEGVDSLVVAEVLSAIGDDLGREVPLTLWFEVATLGDLALRLTQFASHVTSSPREANEDRARAIRVDPARLPPHLPPRSVLLTGATGLLGAHLLETLISTTTMQITCIVRARDDAAAKTRLEQVLKTYEIPIPHDDRLRVIAADLSMPHLGLTDARYANLCEEIDALIHSAAEVSWLASYESLRKPNILGTIELLKLATSRRTKPFHFISTISTAPLNGDEDTTLSFETATRGSPYGLTKWIAEEYVRKAAAEHDLPVAVYRPAMIAAHTTRGIGNPDDFVHRYLIGAIELGYYLDLDKAKLDMTPVDFVAEAIVRLFVDEPLGKSRTHHLVNVDQSMSYGAIGRSLNAAGLSLEPASYQAFREVLLKDRTSRLHALASYFPEANFGMAMGPWPCDRTLAKLQSLHVQRPPVNDSMIASVVRSLVNRGLILKS